MAIPVYSVLQNMLRTLSIKCAWILTEENEAQSYAGLLQTKTTFGFSTERRLDYPSIQTSIIMPVSKIRNPKLNAENSFT